MSVTSKSEKYKSKYKFIQIQMQIQIRVYTAMKYKYKYRSAIQLKPIQIHVQDTVVKEQLQQLFGAIYVRIVCNVCAALRHDKTNECNQC